MGVWTIVVDLLWDGCVDDCARPLMKKSNTEHDPNVGGSNEM